MLATLRHRDFALLWVAGFISVAGDFALLVALPLHAYALTGSAVATGGVFAATLIPSVLLGSIAGVFVDRWDRKRTMSWPIWRVPRCCCRCWPWCRPISSGCSTRCGRGPASPDSFLIRPSRRCCLAWSAQSSW
jgi:hypothetical protein